MAQEVKLQRKLNLTHATVLNMIDMVGIGPFITLPIIMLVFPGKFSLIPWDWCVSGFNRRIYLE